MKNSYMRLENVLDLKKWSDLQDSLSAVTNLAIITVDYRGNPITKHSNCLPFCQAVRNDPELVKHCQKCDSRGGLEAVRTNNYYVYLCHYNIIDIAIPILIDDKYVGAVMAGQVKVSDPDMVPLEYICAPSSIEKATKKIEHIDALYQKIPYLSYANISTIANMLFQLCNYIVEEAMTKNLILETHEKMLHLSSVQHQPLDIPEYSIQNVEHVRNEISNSITNAYIQSPNEIPSNIQHKVLTPIFEYIYNNKNKKENLSLKQAANICHISASYFSRLFTKEVGENFSSYSSRLKIEWSKQLLERTDFSITHISYELGFSDPGYFIKIFKKLESLTPALYRKYYTDNLKE